VNIGFLGVLYFPVFLQERKKVQILQQSIRITALGMEGIGAK
jgi:hypothetical protein